MGRLRALGLVVVGALALAAPAGASTFSVTRSDDPLTGICTPADCSLRQAITAANGFMGSDTVSLPAGTFRLTHGQLPRITDDLTLRGAGAGATIITGGVQSGPATTERAGAIDSGANLTLLALAVSGNTATVNNPAMETITAGAGGVVETGGTLALLGAAVVGNTLGARSTAGAGGVNVNTGTLVAVNSMISGNAATVGGTSVAGGVLINVGGSNSSVVASTINGNSVGSGATVTVAAAGVLSNLSPLSLTNVTVTANNSSPLSASASVGGVFSNLSNLTLTNATIADNTAAGGGAAAGNLDAGGSGTRRLRNTIVAGGVAPSGADCGGTFTSGGGNVVDTNQCGLDIALGDQANTNPILGPLQDNGGPTLTRAIATTSPAVNAALGSFCPATDQRAVVRPQGGGCDAGAFEVGPPLNVAAPSVTGLPRVASTLTCGAGAWRGEPAFMFAWLRNGNAIPGAGAASYKSTTADAGKALQCQVTGTNPIGAVGVVSNAVGVASLPLPGNQRKPEISGTLRAGQRVTCRTGQWSGSPTFSFAWLRDGSAIKKARSAKYKITGRDVGHALQCQVTARNAGGSVLALSAPRVPAKAKAKRHH